MIMALASVSLGGCVANVKPVAAPDGLGAWRIDCRGAVETACGEGAQRTCPSGYKVIASDDDGLTIRCRRSVGSDAVESPGPATTESLEPVPLPPGPAPRTGRHGLLARFGVGWGMSRMNESVTPVPSETHDGNGFAFDLALGGAVSPILAIGGSFAFQQINERVVTYRGQDHPTDNKAQLGVVGVTLDAFATRKSGLHFGGTVGPALLVMTEPSTETTLFSAAGIGYGAHIGYDAHVGEGPWSFDGTLRLLGATTFDGDFREDTWSMALLANVADF
jgi:hypothetical protein